MFTKRSFVLSANYRPRVRVNYAAHLKRALQGPGVVSASIGVEVEPHDILGHYSQSAGFSAVKIAKLLGVSNKDGIKFLQRAIGSKIYKGELLAFKKSLFGKKIVIAPTDGIIEGYDNASGEVKLKFLPKNIPLTAGVYGIVENINRQSGEILIKAMVTEINSVVGSGKERNGTLDILGDPSNLFQASSITADMKSHILFTGALIYGEALSKATGFGIHGIITGGLNLQDYMAMVSILDPQKRIGNDVGISIVATEGFGPITVADDIYNLIKIYNNRNVYINGNAGQLLLPSLESDSILSLRKIALPISNTPHPESETNVAEINLGSRVRLVWPPYMGVQGTVSGIDESPTVLESGIVTFLLTIETARMKIRVPYPNIELI